jgi:hypothetical protein
VPRERTTLNLNWNPDQHRFEVQFQDFASEQPRVKKAGFKTDGPPSWVWYSLKAEPLTKLRADRPATLTISAEARTEYTRLKEMEDRNAATKALLAKHAKELKKKLKGDKQDAMKPDEYFDEGLQCICLKVEPKPYHSNNPFIPPPPPETTCFICGSPVYYYEYGEAQKPACLYCQKEVLDNVSEVC